MPLDEILRNSAPAIGGLLVAAFALAAAHFGRRRSRSRPLHSEDAKSPNPAE